MTLGFDALETGMADLPAVGLADPVLGPRHPALHAVVAATDRPHRRSAILVVSSIVLLTAIEPELASPAFVIGMFCAGVGLGLLASQLGNVNMSAVSAKDTSEVGGLQGVFQNLGSSLGTALIGSILIGALATSFASGVAESTLPNDVQAIVNERTEDGVEIIPASSVQSIAKEAGLERRAGGRTRVGVHRVAAVLAAHAFFGLIALALLSLLVSRGIPNEVPSRTPGDLCPTCRRDRLTARPLPRQRRLPWDGDHRRRIRQPHPSPRATRSSAATTATTSKTPTSGSGRRRTRLSSHTSRPRTPIRVRARRT